MTSAVEMEGVIHLENGELSPLEYLYQCLDLKTKFENPPQARLELYSQAPPDKPQVGAVDVAATTAIQCYAPGIAVMKPRIDEKSLSIATSTLDAGHNTTRLHVYYTWELIGVTRSVTHDVFHSTPFYNTEQQSQRYVEAKMGNFLIPAGLTERQKDIFVKSADQANRAYFEMLELLKPEVERRLRSQYPKGGRVAEERLQKKIPKICQEVARYVLPIGQLTIFDHTLSELQLLRLFGASRLPNFSDEARYVIASMVNEVAKVDPTILTELRKPIEEDNAVTVDQYIAGQRAEFDALLGNKQSKLLLFDEKNKQVLAFAARNVLKIPKEKMSDIEVLGLLLDPRNNRLLADVSEAGMFDPLTNCLRQISMTFATKLSHTADSQRQRHRRTPGAPSVIDNSTILDLFENGPDFFIPMVIRGNGLLIEKYAGETMPKNYLGVKMCFESGIPTEFVTLLFPNGQNLRVVEQGDLFDFLHRWKQRLCYTAQEEIFFITVEQVEQLLEQISEAEKITQAPCKIRQTAGVQPRCPEGGDRWCGQPVFKFDINEYKEHRLV